MATLDWVLDGIFPARAAAQFGQAQFHWGKPPPAAVPNKTTRM
jgi:hypothetical protein